MSLRLGSGDFIPLNEGSVQLVLGIKGGDKEVGPPPEQLDANIVAEVANVLQLEGSVQRITPEHVSAVLARDYEQPLSERDKDSLRAAIVLHCCTHFLSVAGREPGIPTELLSCVLYPRTLKGYNWAAYVLRVTRDSARTVQAELAKNYKTIVLRGCLLYLQVYYLDNIEFGEANVASVEYPRIACYSTDKLNDLKTTVSLARSLAMCQTRRNNSPRDPLGMAGKAELERQRMAREAEGMEHAPPHQATDEDQVMRIILEYQQRSKGWLKDAAEEVHRESVQLHKRVKSRFEVLELRIDTGINELREELLRMYATRRHGDGPGAGPMNGSNHASSSGAGGPAGEDGDAPEVPCGSPAPRSCQGNNDHERTPGNVGMGASNVESPMARCPNPRKNYKRAAG